MKLLSSSSCIGFEIKKILINKDYLKKKILTSFKNIKIFFSLGDLCGLHIFIGKFSLKTQKKGGQNIISFGYKQDPGRFGPGHFGPRTFQPLDNLAQYVFTTNCSRERGRE